MLWNTTIEDGRENKHVFGNIVEFLRNLQTLDKKGKRLTCDTTEDDYISKNIILDIVDETPITGKTFQDIPLNSQLQILSYLDVASLCRAAQVCSLWMQLTDDSLLWESKLQQDANNWQVIDHLTHPENYRRTCPDLTPKEIYIKCCPEYRGLEGGQAGSPLQFSRLRYYLGLSVPRIVMFGSGLDSSGLVNRILMDRRSPFTLNGMFPGQFDGIGSGVTLRHQDGTINLITLYALSKAEREDTDNVDKQSRLLVEEGGSSNHEMTLSQPIKQLCATIDSFIYIIDASRTEKVTHRIEEFKAMIDDRWLPPSARILVLCIVPNATIHSVSSLTVADKLDLLNLSRPWQVRQCHVNSLYGFMPGLKWVTAHV